MMLALMGLSGAAVRILSGAPTAAFVENFFDSTK